MHKLFETWYTNWEELEKTIEAIENTKEKGDAFEEFVFFYFDYYKALYQIQDVFAQVIPEKQVPEDILEKLKLEKIDHGVDGVAVLKSGGILAYQVKFRSGRAQPTAKELATFWAEAERADLRCIVANAFGLPAYSRKMQNHLAVLGDKFLSLDSAFFESLYLYATQKEAPKPKPKYSPRPYQETVLRDILKGFKENNRGKLIAACGIGKTMISLWTSELIGTNTVLFIAPSLALIRQTLKEWVEQASTPFAYLCVCSDKTVDADIQNDYPVFLESDIDIPVTTDPAEISNFLSKELSIKKVVFSTYQSLESIAEAVGQTVNFQFDLTIFDEAHRTAGVSESGLFSLALRDEAISSQKRLFMTATERMVKPWIKSKVEEANRVVFSMDDENVYGPTFYKLSFGYAIENNIIADYRIVLAGITETEVDKLISANRYLNIEELQGDITTETTSQIAAQTAFKLILLLKSIAQLNIQKVITFHSSVKTAKQLIAGVRASKPVFEGLGINTNQTSFIDHINGSLPASVRADIINKFENTELGILSNVRCLSEGVDIPLIDSIFFADPKDSPIDIIQAVGRALRKPYGSAGKIAYIIIPIILPEAADKIEDANNANFEMLYSVIQALRDQDEALADWIDELNLTAVKGRTARGSKSSGKLMINLPEQINLDAFYDFITVKIAEVNKNPTGTTGLGSKLGKTERISSFSTAFGILGDYSVNKYKESCVDPTVDKFARRDEEKARTEIIINHNNISHTERLGLIKQVNKNIFSITQLGNLYQFERDISFNDVFKNQMLLYSVKGEKCFLYPYRAVFEIMKSIESVNIIEFLYGIYSIRAAEDTSASIEEVCDRILLIRRNIPNVQLTNHANQNKVLAELNAMHPVGFNFKDVWTDRTTVANKYRYFVNHLSLFEEIFEVEGSGYSAKLKLKENSSKLIDVALEISRPDDFDFQGNFGNWIWIRRFYDVIKNEEVST
jgi:predicted helicase